LNTHTHTHLFLSKRMGTEQSQRICQTDQILEQQSAFPLQELEAFKRGEWKEQVVTWTHKKQKHLWRRIEQKEGLKMEWNETGENEKKKKIQLV
jgi:hypothetical protein